MAPATLDAPSTHVPWYCILYVQVLIAIVVGVGVGWWFPNLGAAMKPLGDGFIALIKMMIVPVVFCTVVHGIGSMGDLKKVGRVGVKALVYFEVVSTGALAIGLLIGELVEPGKGFNIDPSKLDPGAVSGYVARAHEESFVGHLLAIIPNSFFDAFAEGNLLQVLLIAILTGIAVSRMGELGGRIAGVINSAGRLFFRIIGIIVHAAPIGAFGAMAFTVGAYGVGALWNLLRADPDLLCREHPVRTAGGRKYCAGCRLFDLALHRLYQGRTPDRARHQLIGDGAAAHDAEDGASRRLQGGSGLVIPTGYSFNLDGTNIYMTLATLFLAQATNTHLTLTQELTILAIGMLTSKGASGVTGAGFVTLAATLAIVPEIPIQALAILVGIDKFMSECRALTNLIGNGVATIVISRMERELDEDQLRQAMAHPIVAGEAYKKEIA